jgi:membrane-associated protease RseP (regulator of RpoE activity)
MVLGWSALAGRAGAENGPTLERLIAALGAPHHDARQAAQERLIERGDVELDTVLGMTLRSYRNSDDPEVKYRLRGVLETLVLKHIIDRPRGFLGVRFNRNSPVDEQQAPVTSIEIVSVTPDSAAAQAGLQAGDRLLRAGDLDLTKDGAAEQFVEFIQSKPPGTALQLEIERAGAKQAVDLRLGELPAELRAQVMSEERKQQLFQKWLDDRLRQPGGR